MLLGKREKKANAVGIVSTSKDRQTEWTDYLTQLSVTLFKCYYAAE